MRLFFFLKIIYLEISLKGIFYSLELKFLNIKILGEIIYIVISSFWSVNLLSYKILGLRRFVWFVLF